MEILEKLVDQLEKEYDENQQIGILQNIGKILLTNYIICIDDVTINPLWVEAYYYHKNNFPDCNSHLSDGQKNRFGQLYFHKKGRGGIDICLSKNEQYYLSFLIKASFMKNKDDKPVFKKQTEIYDILSLTEKTEKEIEGLKDILKPNKTYKSNCKVGFTTRVNLTKPCFSDSKLAVFNLEQIANSECDFSFARSNISIVAEEFMYDYIKTHSGLTQRDYEDECRKIFGWLPDNVWAIIKENI